MEMVETEISTTRKSKMFHLSVKYHLGPSPISLKTASVTNTQENEKLIQKIIATTHSS